MRATRAVRSGSGELLKYELHGLLVDGESEWVKDWRDLLIALAPMHDCARRLGLDPAAVFDEAAKDAPATLAEHVRRFGARTDVTPTSFGFRLDEQAPGGPAYRRGPIGP
jgi:hypothetical protein